MKKRDQTGPSDLSQSLDEILLAELMRKSLTGDPVSYQALLMKVKELMIPFIANSISKFGLSSLGGQEDILQEILLGIHLKRGTYDPKQYFLPWLYAGKFQDSCRV